MPGYEIISNNNILINNSSASTQTQIRCKSRVFKQFLTDSHYYRWDLLPLLVATELARPPKLVKSPTSIKFFFTLADQSTWSNQRRHRCFYFLYQIHSFAWSCFIESSEDRCSKKTTFERQKEGSTLLPRSNSHSVVSCTYGCSLGNCVFGFKLRAGQISRRSSGRRARAVCFNPMVRNF